MLWITLAISLSVLAALFFLLMNKKKTAQGKVLNQALYTSMEWALSDIKNCTRLMLQQADSQPLERLGELVNLYTLALSGDALSSLPPVLAKMPQLESLELGATALQELPELLGEMPQLTSLSISHNLELRSAGAFWDKLQNLELLTFNNNPKVGLPPAIFNLKKLVYLHIQNAWIKELPEAIGKLENLLDLNISGNALQQLPDSFGQLAALQILDMSNTDIEKISQQLPRLPLLYKLNCDFCKSIRQSEWEATLPQLQAIRELSLNYTLLEKLPALEKLSQLWRLELLGTDKMDWQQALPVLQTLPALTELRLPNNKSLREQAAAALPKISIS